VDDQDNQPTSRGSEEIVRLLSTAHAYIQTLPPVERRIATLAASGTPIWEIAQQTRESEGAVWRTLDGIIAVVTGREIESVETGGLGADTDPGVTGGYGDTEPIPDNSEPEE
jgi:hypothetical protein